MKQETMTGIKDSEKLEVAIDWEREKFDGFVSDVELVEEDIRFNEERGIDTTAMEAELEELTAKIKETAFKHWTLKEKLEKQLVIERNEN